MTGSENSEHKMRTPLQCMDVQSWRVLTEQELLLHTKDVVARSKNKSKRKKPSVLAVRQHLLPVDMYCYLKARFGEPNGFQNFLRNDTSDNWIHWDFNLRAGEENVQVSGTSREIHFIISENLTDENWRDLILRIKADYTRVGKEKSDIFKSLEKWVMFPNKFVEIADICANLHAEIVDNIGGFQVYRRPSFRTKRQCREGWKVLKQLSERSSKLYKHCLELSLLTPVMAEAFINMVILILCKEEIRNNTRQLDAFIRSNIDAKLFDLSYKCEGFERPIRPQSETFKNFQKVMDKRNHVIHGNCDPKKDQIELVYFEGKRPLFKESGDHIGKFFETLERQHQPDIVVKDYENTYMFLLDIMACLKPEIAERVWVILEDRYPGYDTGRKIVGHLFPDHVFMVGMSGLRYDDELAVIWS